MSALKRTDDVLQAARGVLFTGAVARIEQGGRCVFEQSYGVTRDDALAQPVYVDTRFDLASVGKLFVATLALREVARGAASLDEPASRWIPSWSSGSHASITPRMLLAHTSGMKSGADYRGLRDRNVEAFATEHELVAPPGARVVYSDLGFIALGALIEQSSGRSLATLARETFASGSLGFRPAPHERRMIPATEEDDWRGRVQGLVHDEKAYLMNGIAGHAGVFGTASDVARLAEAYLAHVSGRSHALLPPTLAREAVRESAYDPILRRGLGWSLKTSDDNSCGRWFSASSFGHTGFVGTCVWVDPERDLSAVLLTNTVYFGRSDSRPLRAAFYETLVEELGLC